ncbi:hypothetical protein H8B15_14940 [Hymenobacter sp. BT507]|uniref:YcxB family protein n=1 Tax=Hymenobacter citatus TaxID=2763506 RepID=A0ABR7MNV2_9BACT|nr:hypothetical protein [Hymenobacter citatus]MBC6612223.1 hypothetical protein [Hymenobacter citatus]
MSISADTTIRIPNVCLSLWQYFVISMRVTFIAYPVMWILLIPLAVGVLSWYSLFNGSISLTQLWSNGAGMLHILLMLYVPILPCLTWYGVRKQYKAHHFLSTGASYQLTHDLLIIDTDTMHTELAWPTIQTARRIGSWLILFASANVGHFIDTKQIVDPGNAESIYALLRTKQIVLK